MSTNDTVPLTFKEWWEEAAKTEREFRFGDERTCVSTAVYFAKSAWEAATQAERERCAKIVRDATAYTNEHEIGLEISDTIWDGREDWFAPQKERPPYLSMIQDVFDRLDREGQ